MFRLQFRIACVVLSVSLCSLAAYCQQSVSAPVLPSSGSTTESGAASPKTVTLDAVVDASNAPVGALQQQDFTVYDNKVAQQITSFRAIASGEPPAEVVIVIDAVNTPYTTIAYERGQIANFLRSNGGHLAAPTAIAVLTETGLQLNKGFSSDGTALAQEVSRQQIGLRSVGRSAGFYGASERFQLSIQALGALTKQKTERPGRKLVLWISPGWPILPGTQTDLTKRDQKGLFSDLVALSSQLRQARITLYSIAPLDPGDISRTYNYQAYLKPVSKASQMQVGNLALQVLATQSGGLALNSNNDVAKQLQKCVADASNYYELSFAPSHAAAGSETPEYHRIEVQVAKGGALVRSREGYYTQP